MKTKKQQKHFNWGTDPKQDTNEAERFAEYLKNSDSTFARNDIHVWRDPMFKRTTVEWLETIHINTKPNLFSDPK